MSSYKTEIMLKGEFTTIDVFLEGIEIPLTEINDNEYYRLYSAFKIENPLDIHVRLKGWTGMSWSFKVKIETDEVFSKNGVFDHKGFVTFTESISI